VDLLRAQLEGRARDPMPPGRWTALFFLDEATAFAAGHRPCAYCRRADFLAYARAWGRATGMADRPYAAEMDAALTGSGWNRTTAGSGPGPSRPIACPTA
jgi:hypothetical protein